MPEKIQSPSEIAESVYSRVFRTDFSQPGFALINLGPDCGSETQRQLMIDLKNEFDRLERRYRGRQLDYQSLTRFDQQVTTKPHRVGHTMCTTDMDNPAKNVGPLFSQCA